MALAEKGLEIEEERSRDKYASLTLTTIGRLHWIKGYLEVLFEEVTVRCDFHPFDSTLTIKTPPSKAAQRISLLLLIVKLGSNKRLSVEVKIF